MISGTGYGRNDPVKSNEYRVLLEINPHVVGGELVRTSAEGPGGYRCRRLRRDSCARHSRYATLLAENGELFAASPRYELIIDVVVPEAPRSRL